MYLYWLYTASCMLSSQQKHPNIEQSDNFCSEISTSNGEIHPTLTPIALQKRGKLSRILAKICSETGKFFLASGGSCHPPHRYGRSKPIQSGRSAEVASLLEVLQNGRKVHYCVTKCFPSLQKKWPVLLRQQGKVLQYWTQA